MKPNLYIQTAFLGDLLLSIPTLKVLKKTGRPTILVCRSGLEDLFEKLSIVDRVIGIDKKSALSRSDVMAELLKIEFHHVYCPHESLSSAAMSFRCKAEKKIGFFSWWNFWAFSSRVKRPMKFPEAIRQLSLIEQQNETLKPQLERYREAYSDDVHNLSGPLETGHPAYVPEYFTMGMASLIDDIINGTSDKPELVNDAAIVAGMLKQHGLENTPFYILAPGSVWGTKMWTGYAALGKQLSLSKKVVLMGSPSEKKLCESIAAAIPNAVDLSGTSLMQTLLILRRSLQLFTNDCGAMHLASLAETPCVSVFGPTVLSFGYRPWQNRAIVVENKNLNCRPCGKHGPMVCPLGTHECMTSVLPDDVSHWVIKP